ncbi:hypothetical protein GQ457_18G007200 [Hibiscus cannabinus]
MESLQRNFHVHTVRPHGVFALPPMCWTCRLSISSNVRAKSGGLSELVSHYQSTVFGLVDLFSKSQGATWAARLRMILVIFLGDVWWGLLYGAHCGSHGLHMQHESITTQLQGNGGTTGNMVTSRIPTKWCRPTSSWCKLNMDGVVELVTGAVTCKGVVKDAEGSGVVGIYEGILLAWSIGIRKLHVESDCLEVIQLFQNSKAGRGGYSLVAHIDGFLNNQWSVMVKHVFREENCLTVRRAKGASTADLLCHQFLSSLTACLNQLQRDSSASAHVVFNVG